MSRETWTDERLDDLSGRVSELGQRMDRGFDRVDAELRDIRAETATQFQAVNTRIDALQRTMAQAAIAMSAAFLAGFAGLAALIATQA